MTHLPPFDAPPQPSLPAGLFPQCVARTHLHRTPGDSRHRPASQNCRATQDPAGLVGLQGSEEMTDNCWKLTTLIPLPHWKSEPKMGCFSGVGVGRPSLGHPESPPSARPQPPRVLALLPSQSPEGSRNLRSQWVSGWVECFLSPPLLGRFLGNARGRLGLECQA